MLDGPLVAIIVLAIGGAVAAAYFVFEHRRHRRAAAKSHARPVEKLPLFGTDLLATRGNDGVPHVDEPLDAAGDDGAPVRRRAPEPRRVSPITATPAVSPAPAAPYGATPAQPAPAYGANGWQPAANGRGMGHEPAHAAPSPFAPRPTPAMASAPVAAPPAPTVGDGAFANGETLRFALPDEGTLRFLPGRLEVVAGPDAGREIRFVAPPGAGDAVEVTFGRNEGPAYRHVQLLARTVSRRHAVMALTDGHWSLQNLSATNPVLLNGRALAPDEIAPLLVEGDRIEMGEVVFTFHGR